MVIWLVNFCKVLALGNNIRAVMVDFCRQEDDRIVDWKSDMASWGRFVFEIVLLEWNLCVGTI